MTGATTRRVFLRESGTTAAGLAAATFFGSKSIAADSPALGAGRALGAGLPTPALGAGLPTPPALCVGCRDAHLKLTAAKDCWAAMQSIGAEGVEATIGEDLSLPGLFHPEQKYTAGTEEGFQRLAADLRAAQRRIFAFCMFNRFDSRPQFELDWCTKAAQAAAKLGVKAIRIDLVPRKAGSALAEFLEFSVGTMKKLLAATETTGVCFGIENHGATTNNPEFLGPLLERVASKRLGLTLDTGNFYWFGHPLSKLYELYETFAPRVVHTHCKSIRFPESEREKQRPMGWEYGKHNCPIYEGDIDFARLLKTLRQAGYTGPLCVEDESLGKFPAEQRPKILAKEIAYLKGLL